MHPTEIALTKMKRLPVKMFILVVFGAFVILYQYNLSAALLFNASLQDGSGGGGVIAGLSYANLSRRLLQPTANLPHLYIITPTYRRSEQVAELTRLSHTLRLVPNLTWLVVEDAKEKTKQVVDLLRRSQLQVHHLLGPMPDEYKNRKKGPKPRGVSNRNRGLAWIRQNATNGVFYFADDDNTYDLEIFHEMRFTKRVSMFPVGLITKLGVSSPVVRNGSFVGFYDGWIAGRKFPVDMAGFAVSVRFLLQRPNATMPYKPGYEEDGFLKSLHPFEPKEIELLADKCTRILVWHTQTKKNEPSLPVDISKFNSTNILTLKKLLV